MRCLGVAWVEADRCMSPRLGLPCSPILIKRFFEEALAWCKAFKSRGFERDGTCFEENG